MSERQGESEPASSGTEGGPTVIDVTPTPGGEPEPRIDKRPKNRLAVAALSALMVLVLMLATSPYWAPPVASILPWGGGPARQETFADPTAMNAKLSAIEARLTELAQAQQRAGALEPRVARLEQHPAPAPDPQGAQAVSALGDRLAAIEQRIATLAAAASSQTAADATKGLQTQVQSLSQKLDEQSQLLATLQSREASGADRTNAALAVTVGQLRAALALSRPYAAELQTAEALAKDQPDILGELNKLDSYAQKGIPDLAGLTERFGSVAADARQAAAPPAGASWRERLAGRVKRFFRIRRVAEASDNGSIDPEDTLAAAETALKLGDITGAVTALRRLQGQAAEIVKPWLEDAQARLDAEAALASADRILMIRINVAPPAAGAKP
jgi:hypothetical protein